MKNIAKILVGVAALVVVVGIVSRLTVTPVSGIESRALGGFAALLLLFAIALEGLK